MTGSHPRERRPCRDAGQPFSGTARCCSIHGTAALAGRGRRHPRRESSGWRRWDRRPGGTGGTSGSGGRRRRRSAGGVKLSRPDDPVTLPTFDDIPADRRRPADRVGQAQGLQLPGVHRPRRARGVREGVRGQGRGHDVHQHGRGGRQAGVGRGGRSTCSSRRPTDRQGRRRQAAAAAQQVATSPT